MNRLKLAILAIAVLVTGVIVPEAAFGDDRTDVWLVRGGGAGYRYEGGRTWNEYAANGTLLAELEEQDRGPSHVLLYVKGRDVYLRLEPGRSFTKPKDGGAFVKSRDGDWSTTSPAAWPKPVPREVVTDIWLLRGGQAGYRFEGDRTWREYTSNGQLLAELEEQDRGPSHVLLYVKGRDVYLRLEPGRSFTKPKNGGTFVKNQDGDWSRKTPRAWPRPAPKEVVTDIWLVRGGRAGYRFEGDRMWREYESNGRLLAELEEQDRGPSHVLLYVKGRDVYLRLESGRSLTKPKVGGTFVKNQDGDWSRKTPRAWPEPMPEEVVTGQWLSGNGRAGFRRHSDGRWWEYAADGGHLKSYQELERSASHVLLHDPVGGSYVRLESGRGLVRQKNAEAFVPRWTGKWGRQAPTHWKPVQPEQPQSMVTDVWLVVGGLSGFGRERDGTWREYSAGGKAVDILTEQERGVSHVLLHNAGRDSYVRLEGDRCYTRFRGARDFVPQWNGGWARSAPSHWLTPEPQNQVVVTSVWLMQGGHAGFKHEGGQDWTEYGLAGRPLNTYVEQERGATHVVLYNASRGEHLRLSPGNCLVKLRGQWTFSPQRTGDWATWVPTHWQLPTKLPEIWLMTGGGGYRREGSPPVWVAYGALGDEGLRYLEEHRTAEYVQILNLIQGLRIRLLAGELQTPDETGTFVRRATGGWSDRAPPNWPALPGRR